MTVSFNWGVRVRKEVGGREDVGVILIVSVVDAGRREAEEEQGT